MADYQNCTQCKKRMHVNRTGICRECRGTKCVEYKCPNEASNGYSRCPHHANQRKHKKYRLQEASW